MKLISAFVLLLFSTDVVAAGGFTWLAPIASATHLPDHVLTLIFVGLILITVGFIYRSKISSVKNAVIPDKNISVRNIVEAFGSFIYNQCVTIIGEEQGPKYFPFIITTFLVILLSNLIGLIPGFLPPTEHLSTTLALGAFSFMYYNIKGCKVQGTFNYIKHFCGPLWYLAVLIFPLEIISNFIRPLSLALRLRSNMMGDHLVLGIFSGLAPFVIPIIFMILGILVSLIQAFVFSVLSMVYIALAVSHDHDEEHAH